MKKMVILTGLALLLGYTLVRAWWVDGHARVAEAAASGLPDDVPAFFRDAGKQLGHLSGDPDRWKNPSCKHLKAAEAPDHFIDLEDYQGNKLPEDRYQAVALLQKLKQKPERVGMLPYAIMENYDRLRCAFYDYREVMKKEKKDGDEVAAIRAKCVVYAGILAHFTGDCVMPLHTTRNFDGRPDKEGKVRQKGIHAKIDAFPERFGLEMREIRAGLTARQVEDVWGRVLATIDDSHALVERCYEFDDKGAFDKPTPESRKFILERCRAGAQLTMDLWLTAWKRSATMPRHY